MKYLIATLAILLMNGCSPLEDTDEVLMPSETNGNIIKQLFNNQCTNIDKVWYKTQEDTNTYFNDTANLVNFWDTRYTTEQVTSVCTPALEFSTKIDTRTNTSTVNFGGPQSTLIHRFTDRNFPWQNNGNLMMQVEFTDENYQNFNTNIGGTISFNLFVRNSITDERLNYVIAIYAYGQAWKEEQPDILFDDSNNTSFVGTLVKPNTKYATMSNISSQLNDKKGFFRANISSQNLYNALESKGVSNINLNEWYVSFIGIQFEIEEEGGDASLSGNFKNFSSYITTSPM